LKVAALLVGVGADVSGIPPLKYPEVDALAIAECLRSAADSDESLVITLTGEHATPEAIDVALRELAQRGDGELAIVMISAHGYVNPDGSSGLLFARGAGNGALSAEALSQLICGLRADKLLCLLDCCYAEAIAARMSCFSVLGRARARIYIGSSRASQLTWEDEGVKHGIFTAFLLDALSGAAFGRSKRSLDVQADLFPFLRAQVPLYVLETKQHSQEPVIGGVASDSIILPIVGMRLGKSSTPLATALRRVRQILASGVVAAAGALLISYWTLYYASVTDSGEVVLNHGVRSLEALFPNAMRISTGLRTGDVSPDAQVSHALYVGHVDGIWSHLNRNGVRAWIDKLLLMVTEQNQNRLLVLLGLRPGYLTADDKGAIASWKAEIAGMHAIVSPDDVKLVNDFLEKSVPGAELVASPQKINDQNKFDFGAIDLRPVDFRHYARAIRLLATQDPTEAAKLVLRLCAALQHKVAHTSRSADELEWVEEVTEDLGSALKVILRSQQETEKLFAQALTPDHFNSLGRVIAAGAPTLAVALKLDDAATAVLRRTDFNKEFSIEALSALRILVLCSNGSSHSRGVIDETYRLFVNAGRVNDSFLSKFLLDVSERHSLGRYTSDRLVRRLAAFERQPVDFEIIDLTRILAGSLSALPAEDADVVMRSITVLVDSSSAGSELVAQSLSSAAKEHKLTDQMLRHIVAQARNAVQRFAPSEPVFTPGALILSTGTQWIVTLSDTLTAGYEVDSAEELLMQALRQRGREWLTDAVALALLRHPAGDGQSVSVRMAIERLGTLPHDSARRLLAARQLGFYVAALPSGERLDGIVRIRKAHALEPDPEVRIVLGEALAAASKRQ
jgi:hypothetical protein